MRFEGEYFHVWNRGARAGALFIDEEDHRRFLMLLFLSNAAEPLDTRTLRKRFGGNLSYLLFNEPIGKDFVDIIAYSLAKDRFQLILREKRSGGVERFMRKFATAYAMYFNAKYRHDGTLFQGRYKSKRITSDSHLRYTFARVHLETLELAEPRWKDPDFTDKKAIRMFLSAYPYSSYRDYQIAPRIEGALLSPDERVAAALRGKTDIDTLFTFLNSDRPGTQTKDRPSYQNEGITS